MEPGCAILFGHWSQIFLGCPCVGSMCLSVVAGLHHCGRVGWMGPAPILSDCKTRLPTAVGVSDGWVGLSGGHPTVSSTRGRIPKQCFPTLASAHLNEITK